MEEIRPRSRRGSKLSVLLCALCIYVVPKSAYDQQDSSTVLDAVPVTHRDSILRISVIQSSVPYYRIDEEKLNELGVRDAADALKFIPGVQIRDYGGMGGLKTISYRSLGSQHTQVMLDGFLLNDAQSGSINLSTLDMLGVQSVSFVSGQPQGVKATASTYLHANLLEINSVLCTRPVHSTAEVYSSAQTTNTFENGLLFRTPVGGKMFFGVSGIFRSGSGEYDYRYPISGFDGTVRRDNAWQADARFRLAGGVNFNGGRLYFQGFYRNNYQELPGAVVLYNPYNDQQLWSDERRGSAHFVKLVGRGEIPWLSTSQVFIQQNYTRYLDPDFLNAAGKVDSRFNQLNSGGGTMLRRRFKREGELFYTGIDVIWSQLKANELVGEPQRTQTNSVIGISKWLVKDRVITDASLAFQVVDDRAVFADSSSRSVHYQPTPFVSLAWLPFKKEALRIRTFYKRTFRLPSFNDLYYNASGEVNLLPERAHIFNAGITAGKSMGKVHLEFSADGYSTLLYDKLIAIPTKDIFTWSVQNIGKSRSSGVDAGLFVSYRIGKPVLTLGTNHNWNNTIDISDETSSTYENQLPYTPFYSSSHSLSLKYGIFGFQSNLIYTGFRYSLNENIYENYLEPFADLNVGLSAEFESRYTTKTLGVWVKVMNLIGKNYEVIRSYPMPSRYLQVVLKASI